jgi:hypothetical protein
MGKTQGASSEAKGNTPKAVCIQKVRSKVKVMNGNNEELPHQYIPQDT